MLTQSGVVRSDIRSSFGSMSGTASGVPLTITLKLVNTASSCASLEGLAVYLWHCTADGNYSLYSSGITNQNYLRGVQVSDAPMPASCSSCGELNAPPHRMTSPAATLRWARPARR